MSLDQDLRWLLEKNTNLHIPLQFGDPLTVFRPGAVIDMGNADRPTLGYLGEAPFNLTLPEIRATGALDIALSMKRSLGAKAGASVGGGDGTATGQASVTLEVKSGRDVFALVEPHPGEQFDQLLGIGAQLAKHPAWNPRRYAFVARVFAVARGEVAIARTGNGTITLHGEAKAVSKALSGELSAGVTWTKDNLYTKSFEQPGVFGMHVAKVGRNGIPRML